MEGTVLTDIDEGTNHILVRVSDSSLFAGVRSLMALNGIPEDAYIIDVGTPGRSLETLQDRRRPVPGGMQLRFLFSNPSNYLTCTVGFNARLSAFPDSAFFVTAAHCSPQIFGSDNTTYYNDGEDPNNFLGREVLDPQPLADGYWCPVNHICRWSDALLVGYEHLTTSAFGGLAYPVDFYNKTIQVYPGALLSIVDDDDPVYQGDPMLKLGSQGGATGGTVTRWCFDITHFDRTDVTMLCQGSVRLAARPGDSGSPLYDIVEPYHIRLRAILWGGWFSGEQDSDSIVVSGMGNVRNDLGNLTTY